VQFSRSAKTGQLIVRFSIIFLTGQIVKKPDCPVKNRTPGNPNDALLGLPEADSAVISCPVSSVPIRRNPIRRNANPNPNPNFGESGFGESGRHRPVCADLDNHYADIFFKAVTCPACPIYPVIERPFLTGVATTAKLNPMSRNTAPRAPRCE